MLLLAPLALYLIAFFLQPIALFFCPELRLAASFPAKLRPGARHAHLSQDHLGHARALVHCRRLLRRGRIPARVLHGGGESALATVAVGGRAAAILDQRSGAQLCVDRHPAHPRCPRYHPRRPGRGRGILSCSTTAQASSSAWCRCCCQRSPQPGTRPCDSRRDRLRDSPDRLSYARRRTRIGRRARAPSGSAPPGASRCRSPRSCARVRDTCAGAGSSRRPCSPRPAPRRTTTPAP